MSKRFIDEKERQCLRKKKFLTRKDAKRSARRRFVDYRDMHAYKCPWCDTWHVGHKPGKPKKYKQRQKKRAAEKAAEELEKYQ